MNQDALNQIALNQIALTLTKHFDCLYYVDIETGKYTEYTSGQMLETTGIPHSGADFFTETQQYALSGISAFETLQKHLTPYSR